MAKKKEVSIFLKKAQLDFKIVIELQHTILCCMTQSDVVSLLLAKRMIFMQIWLTFSSSNWT